MVKTALKYLQTVRPELFINHEKAITEAGWYRGFEFRIKSDDPKFNRTEKYCEECEKFHYSPYEGKWIHPNVPLRIGENWAKVHHIQSIIESREIHFEKKIGKKSYCLRTWVDCDSFEPQSDWIPYQIISKLGKVTTVGEIHTPKKKGK